jgi:hypothetical protein
MRGAITDPRPHRTNGSHLSNACQVASGIAPSWASRRRGHRAVFHRAHESLDDARDDAQSACWDVCAVPHVVFENTWVA